MSPVDPGFRWLGIRGMRPGSYIETYKKIRHDKFRASKLPIKQC